MAGIFVIGVLAGYLIGLVAGLCIPIYVPRWSARRHGIEWPGA